MNPRYSPKPRPRVLIVIPARSGGTRLPDKLLLNAGDGRTLFEHTLSHAKECSPWASIVVATNNDAIALRAAAMGYSFIKCCEPVENGTRRVARAALTIAPCFDAAPWDVVINWQADEVDLREMDVLPLVEAVRRHSQVATLVRELEPGESVDHDVVKACVSRGRAVWFDRGEHRGPNWHAHVGVYAFRPTKLYRCASLPTEPIAEEESLEQLTWLVNGVQIGVVGIEGYRLAINSSIDLEKLRERYR